MQLEQRFRREAENMLKLAAEADRAMMTMTTSIFPSELARREDRIHAIKEAKERIRARENERMERDKACSKMQTLAERREFERLTADDLKGSQINDRIKRNPNAQINLTDADSRVMNSSDGFVQAYNGQAAVDCASMFIVAAHLTQHPIDCCK